MIDGRGRDRENRRIHSPPRFMNTKRTLSFALALSIATSMSIPAAFAKAGYMVPVKVKAVTVAEDNAPAIPKAYINLYDITLVDNQYVGKLIKTVSTGLSGKLGKFTIKVDQTVDFLAFSDMKSAKMEKAHTFQVPPLKNFSANGIAPGKLCHTAGIDFADTLKSPAGQPFCASSFVLELQK